MTLPYLAQPALGRCRTALLFLALFWTAILFPFHGTAQQETEDDEVLVQLTVARMGSMEVPAIIRSDKAYLSIKELFDFLKVKAAFSPTLDSLSGFLINPTSTFLIEGSSSRITYLNKAVELKAHELIEKENGLYLRTELFGEIFGLDCSFNFRNLSVTLTTELELPALRELELEALHKNLSQLKGEKKPDTTIGRRFTLFHFGVADWSFTATQDNQGTSNTRASLALGGQVIGGETDLYLNYYSRTPFSFIQQYLQWRYVNNELPSIRQITLGRILTPSISTLYFPLTGVAFTNTPTTYRRSFGSYRISNTTEPGWTVELYVNNVLINYVKADASGFYSFDVPLVYGGSQVKLRFYGPWGEERVEEQNIMIPFNFLPGRKLEYNISGGMLADSMHSRFSRALVNYGLHRSVTIGAGVEYLSAVSLGRPMPFVNTSLRVLQSLILSGEEDFGVRTKGTLSYQTLSRLQLQLDWTSYQKGQDAIKTNFLQQRSAVLMFPFNTAQLNTFSRISFNSYELTGSRYSSVEYLLSLACHRLSANLTNSAIFPHGEKTLVYTNLSLTFLLPHSLGLMPQLQYGYQEKSLRVAKADLQKSLRSKGTLNLTYERNTLARISSWSLGLHFNFAAASTMLWASHSRGVNTSIESAFGSLIHDAKTKYNELKNNPGIGKGSITLLAFLDINCNGRKDKNEPSVPGLRVRANGGRVIEDQDEKTIRILDLEAYTPYQFEVDPGGFDNVAWQVKNKTVRVIAEPNQIKVVEIPVAVVGEVSGQVYLNSPKGLTGLGRMMVNIYGRDSLRVGRTLTEGDGYFSYMGLSPGSYFAQLDSAQLQLLHLKCTPASLSFSIAESEEGVVADGFEFKLTALPENTATSLKPAKGNDRLRKPNASTSGLKQNPSRRRYTVFVVKGSSVGHKEDGLPDPKRKQSGPELSLNDSLSARMQLLPHARADITSKRKESSITQPGVKIYPKKLAPAISRTRSSGAAKTKSSKPTKKMEHLKQKNLPRQQQLLREQLLRLLQQKQHHLRETGQA